MSLSGVNGQHLHKFLIPTEANVITVFVDSNVVMIFVPRLCFLVIRAMKTVVGPHGEFKTL
jgi:hypothetical protein